MPKTHWMSWTRFYRLYCHIRNRCNRIRNENYLRYWGKGIKNMRNNFKEFYDDMYTSYLGKCEEVWESNVSIDRINNSGDYCKENCRWIHVNKQQSNRDMNHYLEYKGKRQTLREWAQEQGITEWALRNRILYYWRDTERALETPTKNNYGNPEPMTVYYQWRTYTVRELQRVVKRSRKTIYRKISSWELKVK